MFGKKDKEQKALENIPNAEKRGWGKPLTLMGALLLDGVGMLSYLLPAYGEAIDTVWAPLSAIILFLKFGRNSLPAVLLEFTEELLPFTDFIPTFTLTYLYKKYYKPNF